MAVEMDERGCEFMKFAVGVNVTRSNKPEEALRGLPSSSVIAMWHSLEHLADPWGVLDEAVGNLEPGGYW